MDHEQLKIAIEGEPGSIPSLAEPRWNRLIDLRRLDAVGDDPLRARAAAPMGGDFTYSVPRAFYCSDGGTWWLKAKAQQGLCAELVAGRLAALAGAGPLARPVYVGHDAIAGELGLIRFRGHVVGIEHRAGAESSKKLRNFVAGQNLQLPIDATSRAVVIAFQTWLDVSDAQVLVNLVTGAVESHDHGDTFGELRKGPPSRVVVAKIPGVPDHVGLGLTELDAAVRRIECVTELDILTAVASVPNEPGWQGLFERRLAIAEWLIKRQARLREVLLRWKGLPQ